MQQKKTNKILIVTVALIWGVVVYKFATPFFASTGAILTAESLVTPLQAVVRKKDTFSLKKLVRDPFLGKIYREKKVVSTPVRSIVKKRKITKQWPRIQYLGYVNPKKKSKLVLVRINGVLKRVYVGDLKLGVKIKAVSENKITIQFEGEEKDFQKVN